MRWALTLGAVAHLILAWGVGLSVDEAHYALYAYHLDWSYFDHPPLVGWLQWPAVALGGSDWALRIVPLGCAMATACLLWRITTDWVLRHGTQADAQTAAQGVLWLWLSAPMVHLLTLALVPDSLLMPIALALLLVTLRLAHNPQATGGHAPYPWRDWAALGLCLGLAGLTKYTAVLLVPGVFCFLTLSLGWRWLRGPGPWLAAAIALLLISPVLWWNHQHGWISFAYQWGHAGGREEWQAKRVLGFVLVQSLVFGPLSWWALVVGWRRMTSPSRTAWLALCMALPALCLTLFLSGRGSALPHWTSWSWVLLLPFGAWAWRHSWPHCKRWLMGAVALQALASVALCVGLAVGRPANPFADVQGWQSAAERAAQVAQTHGLRTLTVVNWSLASRLAWYARPLPVIVAQSHQDQFDLWFGHFKPGDDALWVDWSVKPYPPPIASAGEAGFAQCDWVQTHESQHLGQVVASFAFHVCRDWKPAS
jgi:4-amino-4-deoxy-L-arabinose transferase-like glycosyltransferase